MRQDVGEGALRELEHKLRNELFALQLRSRVAAEDTVKRRADLKALLVGIEAILAEIARRRDRSE